jgi:mannitol-1-phosphate 5-dehydrogenase
MLDCCKCRIIYVDKDKTLVDMLKNRPFEVLQIGLDGGRRTCKVDDFEIYHTGEQDGINRAFAEADIVLTCVIAENLDDVSQKLAASVEYFTEIQSQKKLNIVACENLNRASSLLKELTIKRLSEKAAAVCEKQMAFPDAVISRVVPVPADPLKIICEDYNEWYADAGNWTGDLSVAPFIDLSDNLDALLERKLWIHNGGHASLAYAAWRHGCKYIHEAVGQPEIAGLAVETMREIGDCIIRKYGFGKDEIREYEAALGRRGAIAEMKDEVRRVIRDQIRKLGKSDRLVGPLIYAYENGLKFDCLIKSVVNILGYCDESDAESVKMKSIIEGEGVSVFLNRTIGLEKYPGLVEKIKEIYDKNMM